MLEDDAEWETALSEVVGHGSAGQVRATFAIILQFCDPKRILFIMKLDIIIRIKKTLI